MQPTNGQPTDVVESTEANPDTSTPDSINSQLSADLLIADSHTLKLVERAEKFKDYVDSQTEFFKTYYNEVLPNLKFRSEDLNAILQKKKEIFLPLHDLVTNYKEKFDQSYEKWKKQVIDYGEIYFNNDIDRLHLSICSSRFTNDDYNSLTPFGDSLVGNGEIMNHHQIGILDAIESQLPTENLIFESGHEGLISAQVILLLMYEQFIEFCDGWSGKQEAHLKGDWQCPPLIQFSDSNTGAWAADREIPTIIHVNKSIATRQPKNNDPEEILKAHKTRVTAYAASPHEFGHDITDTFIDDKLITTIFDALKETLISSNNDNAAELAKDNQEVEPTVQRKIDIWKSWIHEVVADTFGDGILGKVSLQGLKHVLTQRLDLKSEPVDLIFENWDWDWEERPYDEHPNSFLRVLISIEVIYQLNKKDSSEDWAKWRDTEWNDWLNQDGIKDKVNVEGIGGNTTLQFKDQRYRGVKDMEYFSITRTELETITETILTAPITWFPKDYPNLQSLIHQLVDNPDLKDLLNKLDKLV